MHLEHNVKILQETLNIIMLGLMNIITSAYWIYKSWRAIVIIDYELQLYSCVVLVNPNFNETKCADCSIRVY